MSDTSCPARRDRRRRADASPPPSPPSFEQYRGKLMPESGAFRETADAIAAELAHDCRRHRRGAERRVVGCVMVKLMEDDLYFGRLPSLPAARGHGIARRLIEAVEDEARRRELAGVRLGVRIVLTENQRLFTSLGYRRDLARGPSRASTIRPRSTCARRCADILLEHEERLYALGANL